MQWENPSLLFLSAGILLVVTVPAFAQGRTATVQVPANQAWTSTGVTVSAGQTVEIAASGVVEASSAGDTRSFYHQVPPEGRWERHAEKPAPLLPALALLCRVGNGPIFLVGAGAKFTAGSPYGTGEVWLGINDDILSDNSGSWSARVSVGGGGGGSRPAEAIPANWGTTAVEFRGQNGRRITLACGAGGQPSRLWGTDIYTDDSSVCAAAVHAGLITAVSGGTVTIEIRPGQESYSGTTRNGVSSAGYGSWSGSFVVLGGVGGREPATPAASSINWGATAVGYRGQNGRQFSFACPGGGQAGRVWGTDVYTDDSSICTAAVHAGFINLATGGTVTIEIRPGQQSYTGSVRRGVSSDGYGSWSGSYVFVRQLFR